MLTNSIFGNSWGNGWNSCGCNSCGNSGNLGNAAFCFVGEWVNIVVTLTILQSILGLVCNWNCGGCNN
jgi:hypothetical protein